MDSIEITDSEDIKEFKNDYVSIKMRKNTWLEDGSMVWDEWSIYFTAECGGLSIFGFKSREEADQFFLLMIKGIE